MDSRDNPRMGGDTMDRLIYYGTIVGGSFLTYRLAATGTLGAAMQTFANQLHAAIAGTSLPSVSVGGGGVRVALPGAPSGSGGGVAAPPSGQPRCPDFIAGQQYVADRHDGTYELVIGGALVGVYSSQAAAEAAYRQRFGCG